MRPETKQRKLDELAAELLTNSYGREVTVDEIRAIRGAEETREKENEATAVLLFVEQPRAFQSKECDNCGRLFLTTYKFVTLCCNKCRITSLAKMGIKWNPTHTADERWHRAQIPIPYIIPPDALEVLITLAQLQKSREQTNTPLHPVPVSANNHLQSSNGVHKSLEPALP